MRAVIGQFEPDRLNESRYGSIADYKGWFTHFSLRVLGFGRVALQDGIVAVQQELPEHFNSVALPVLDPAFEFFHGAVSFFHVNGFVGALKYRGSSFNTLVNILLPLFVKVAFLAQFLLMSVVIDTRAEGQYKP